MNETRYYYTEKRAVIAEVIGLILTILGIFIVRVLMNWCEQFVLPNEIEAWEKVSRMVPGVYLFVMVLYHIHEIISIYLRKRCTCLIIRRDEIVFCRGFFTRRNTTIPVNRIKDCSTESGILQQICGTMTLLLTTAGDQREICFVDIKNGEEAEKLINKLIR